MHVLTMSDLSRTGLLDKLKIVYITNHYLEFIKEIDKNVNKLTDAQSAELLKHTLYLMLLDVVYQYYVKYSAVHFTQDLSDNRILDKSHLRSIYFYDVIRYPSLYYQASIDQSNIDEHDALFATDESYVTSIFSEFVRMMLSQYQLGIELMHVYVYYATSLPREVYTQVYYRFGLFNLTPILVQV